MTKLPEDDAEAVLSLIEEGGVFDELRQQLISKIKQNTALQDYVQELILCSSHLPKANSDKRTMQAACELIRKELTGKVMERLVVEVWEEMSKEGSLSQAIDDQTHKALCTVYEKRAGKARKA